MHMIFFGQNSQPIRLLHTLGGCGGTLLAQCIGALQDVILLSEVNPLSACIFDLNLNPYIQLQKWHPELYEKIRNEFEPDDLQHPKKFRKFISKIKKILDKNKKYLIIRDYNYIDYFGIPFLDAAPNNSSLLGAIKNKFALKQVVLIRHPSTQYNSLRSHDILKNTLSPNVFLNGYHAFLKDFEGCKIIKYEEVVANPAESVADLSRFWDIPFTANFLQKFNQNQSITGNLKRAGDANISLSNLKLIDDPWTDELQKHPQYKKLLDILEYQPHV